MTPQEFKAIRKSLLMTQRGMGKQLGLEGSDDTIVKAVRRWEDGTHKIRGPIKKLMAYIQKYGFLD